MQKWHDVYLKHGIIGTTAQGTYTTGYFKVFVVEYMHKTGGSIRKTGAYFNIPSPPTVRAWEHI